MTTRIAFLRSDKVSARLRNGVNYSWAKGKRIGITEHLKFQYNFVDSEMSPAYDKDGNSPVSTEVYLSR